MRKAWAVVAVLGLSGMLAACGGGASSVSAKTTKAAPSSSTKSTPPTVMTATSPLGTILVAANGRTLYELDGDTATMSTCTGSCAMLWPPLTVTGKPIAGAGVDQSLLTVLNGPNGSQVVYAGHPLYEFAQDTAPGDVKGQNFAGNIWHVLTAAGQEVMTPLPTAPTTPTTAAAPSRSGSGSSGSSSGMSGGYGY